MWVCVRVGVCPCGCVCVRMSCDKCMLIRNDGVTFGMNREEGEVRR